MKKKTAAPGKKKGTAKSKRNESAFGFAVKALLGIVGVALLILVGYVLYIKLSPAPTFPKEFTTRLHGIYGSVKGPLQGLIRDWGKAAGQDPWKQLETTRANFTINKNALLKVEPKEDGRVWYNALSKMVERGDKLLSDLEGLKSQPPEEAVAKGRQRLEQFDKELASLDADVQAARRQYMAAHNLQ